MEPAKDSENSNSTLQPVESEGNFEVKRVLEKELFSWKAPARPFKRRNREFYVTIIAIAFIVGLVLLLAEGLMPVILLVSLIFLYYVMNTIEPETLEYKITNFGIRVAGKITPIGDLIRFWFAKRFDSELLVLQTISLPGRLELVINPEDKGKIRDILKDFVTEEELPPSILDKAANWFSKRLPGNN